MNTYNEDTPFINLVEFIKNFNRINPDRPQPITDEILSLLNELGGIGVATQWKDAGWFDKIKKYSSDFNQLPDLQAGSIKHLKIDFGTSVVKIDSEMLLNQVHKILRDHLKRKYPNIVDVKEGNKSQWLRVITQGKPLLEKLFAAGITDDFFAHYFEIEVETFTRKRSDIISLRTVKKHNF